MQIKVLTKSKQFLIKETIEKRIKRNEIFVDKNQRKLEKES
jgi:hypothetical protein